MKQYYGQQSDIDYLSNATLVEIAKKYKEIAYGDKTEIKATTILALSDSNGCTLRDKDNIPLYDCVYFFDIREPDSRQINPATGQIEQSKPKLQLKV